MRVGVTLSVALSFLTVPLGGPFALHHALGDDVVDDIPSELVTDAFGVATRGTAQQITDTLPPPPTAAPGDSFEIPADSGSGRRVVYSKGFQRVWLIEADGVLHDTHRVSGRIDQPLYGTYTVWSRSMFTCSRASPDICMRFMVRFAYSFRGDNIGFHEIPQRDGVPLQTADQLGEPLSGGCVRQITPDALLMWDWAQLGTPVVVVP